MSLKISCLWVFGLSVITIVNYRANMVGLENPWHICQAPSQRGAQPCSSRSCQLPLSKKGPCPLTTFYLQNNSPRLKILCLELKSTVLFCRLPLFVFKSFIWSNLKSVCCLSVGSAPSMLAVICPLLPPFSKHNLSSCFAHFY